ncbi:MAG: sugar phosphate isomerase/epimerase, partial [Gemmatimonadetes bacterium]|nr:sugar phosphate isomerase/epimerase [Gemmatimonadota bacterium]
IRSLFDRHDFDMPAVAGHCSVLARDPDEHAKNWARLTGAIDLCADWAGPSGPPVLETVLGGGQDEWEAVEELAVERLAALAAYSAERGVTIAIEPHVGCALDTPEKSLRLLDRIDSPHFKINFDISHFDVLGIPTAESVAALVPHAVHTHVKDQRGRYPDHEFLIPGEGPFDYVDYMREMDKAGYDGYITGEVSMMVHRRPDYDPVAAAELTYKTLAEAFDKAGISH